MYVRDKTMCMSMLIYEPIMFVRFDSNITASMDFRLNERFATEKFIDTNLV